MIRAKDKELDVARQQLKAAAALEARVHVSVVWPGTILCSTVQYMSLWQRM